MKYPLITEDIATKKIAGDNVFIVNSASGTHNIIFAIYFAPKNKNEVPINPITAKVTNAILKTLCAPLLSPTASLSATSFAIAFGTPMD